MISKRIFQKVWSYSIFWILASRWRINHASFPYWHMVLSKNTSWGWKLMKERNSNIIWERLCSIRDLVQILHQDVVQLDVELHAQWSLLLFSVWYHCHYQIGLYILLCCVVPLLFEEMEWQYAEDILEDRWLCLCFSLLLMNLVRILHWNQNVLDQEYHYCNNRNNSWARERSVWLDLLL